MDTSKLTPEQIAQFIEVCEHDAITAAELDTWDKLCAEATPEPWTIRTRGPDDPGFVEYPRQEGQAYGQEILADDDYPTKVADIAFVSAARNAMPRLIAAVQEAEECTRQLEELHERNKKEIQRLRTAVEKYGQHEQRCDSLSNFASQVSSKIGIRMGWCTCGLKDVLQT